jgi:hypothetical protein
MEQWYDVGTEAPAADEECVVNPRSTGDERRDPAAPAGTAQEASGSAEVILARTSSINWLSLFVTLA